MSRFLPGVQSASVESNATRRVRLFTDLQEFSTALATVRDTSYYLVFAQESLPYSDLERIQKCAHRQGHIDIGHEPELRGATLAHIRSFYTWTEQADTTGRFAFAAKVPLASPQYAEVQRLFLLLSHTESPIERPVMVYCADPSLVRVIEKIGDEDGEEIPFPVSPRPWQALMRIGRTALRIVWLRLRHPWAGRPLLSKHQKRCPVLIYGTHPQVPTVEKDPYFGAVYRQLVENGLGLRVYLAAGSQVAVSVHQESRPLESWMTFGDFVRAALETFRNRVEYVVPPPHPLYSWLYGWLAGLEIATGETAMLLMMRLAYPRMLASLAPKTVTFPYECRTWERNLISACREANIRVVAYQHSSISPRHLVFHLPLDAIRNDQLPECVITVGQVTFDLMHHEFSKRGVDLIPGVSLRREQSAANLPAGEAVLIPISSSLTESRALIRFAHGLSEVSNVPIIVRPHPTIPVNEIWSMYDWPHWVRLSEGSTLSEDLVDSAYVAYASSTVVLEAMLVGRLPIFINTGDLPTGDPLAASSPLRGEVSSPGELAEKLRQRTFFGLDPEATREKVRVAAEAYLVKPEKHRCDEIVALLAGLRDNPSSPGTW